MTTPLDLREMMPEEAARALHAFLREWATECGYFPEDVLLHSPRERANMTGEEQGVWGVAWEAGPFEWAIPLSLDESLNAGEHGYGAPPEVLVVAARHYLAQPYYSFDLGFYPESAEAIAAQAMEES